MKEFIIAELLAEKRLRKIKLVVSLGEAPQKNDLLGLLEEIFRLLLVSTGENAREGQQIVIKLTTGNHCGYISLDSKQRVLFRER